MPWDRFQPIGSFLHPQTFTKRNNALTPNLAWFKKAASGAHERPPEMTALQRAAGEEGGLLAVDLEALAGAFDNEDPALVVHFHRDRPLEQFLPLL